MAGIIAAALVLSSPRGYLDNTVSGDGERDSPDADSPDPGPGSLAWGRAGHRAAVPLGRPRPPPSPLSARRGGCLLPFLIASSNLIQFIFVLINVAILARVIFGSREIRSHFGSSHFGSTTPVIP